MSEVDNWTAREKVFAFLAVGLMLLFHGAVPFLMTPTLGQAVWTTGFAKSFANGPLYSIYAHDFGFPKPAAIAFGLAGALPESWLIRLGLRPSDAYAGMVALWLILAFCSAYLISRTFGASRSVSILSAMTWMSMPTIWAHAGYSMLSLGIALLPFYFLVALNLFQLPPVSGTKSRIFLHFSAAFVSVFMDGYTFIMFATGSSILLCYFLLTDISNRRYLLTIALPIHIASFCLAYLAYTIYVGKDQFETSPIDFFRGWGLDLSFIVVPTKSFHWFLDFLGVSIARTDALYFGDASVWRTTFSLPVILAGLFAWWQVRRKRSVATGFLAVAIVGFFMALGPTLKINAIKPEHIQITQPRQQSAMMPAEYGLGPTGSTWISETLPGFKSMRASYRWSALGILALWASVIVWAGSSRRGSVAPVATLMLITFLNIPNLPQKYRSLTDNRAQFLQVDEELIDKLRVSVKRNEVVAFAPWGNDFMANYLAPAIGFRTFNIGGDKNLTSAQANWPPAMLALSGRLDTSKISLITKILRDRNADVVVIPYFDMLWSAHLWPCLDQTRAKLTEVSREDWNAVPGFYCPDQRKMMLRSVIQEIEQLPDVEVADSNLFATVRLRRQLAAIIN
ncbi:hypothetical protein [Rhizobium rhizogenes]|uniref:hypothetical protein n=1 Tax=Rhizobium rhizogenes TaxID=359 RepID=UPI0004D64DE3|nr:hypothetical protein [Rhizobium rhizogenes]KEA04741.1 hypothetical protein CN09_18210 [Rhizobium rhizogenes]MQB33792.1 hypothetical protein [Rhizobium rhizogenes]NTI43433.1 hypothetical protein [Rhizobium rhizogenes]NTI82661.1 hypothetical protein [Rhizobium rhizogenes]NTJ24843.1 hypothetical protein [Rhizobium rhizogenes]